MIQKLKPLTLIFCFFSTALMANEDIKFDVKLPSKISIKKQLKYTVSFTNKSKKPILMPNFILGGIGMYYGYTMYDELGNRVIPGVVYEYHISHEAINNKSTFLQPKEIRYENDYLDTKDFFRKPGRYRIVFYWDGFLDGNTEGELSRFSCEKWITVTK